MGHTLTHRIFGIILFQKLNYRPKIKWQGIILNESTYFIKYCFNETHYKLSEYLEKWLLIDISPIYTWKKCFISYLVLVLESVRIVLKNWEGSIKFYSDVHIRFARIFHTGASVSAHFKCFFLYGSGHKESQSYNGKYLSLYLLVILTWLVIRLFRTLLLC